MLLSTVHTQITSASNSMNLKVIREYCKQNCKNINEMLVAVIM